MTTPSPLSTPNIATRGSLIRVALKERQALMVGMDQSWDWGFRGRAMYVCSTQFDHTRV